MRNILQNVTKIKLKRLIIAVKSCELAEVIQNWTQFEILQKLNSTQPIHGLHVSLEHPKDIHLIPDITHFNHLRKFEVVISAYKEFLISDLTNVLLKELVHLKNLSLSLNRVRTIAGETYVVRFVRFAGRMKCLTFKFNNWSDSQFKLDSNDLNKMAAIRLSVGGCSMRIHIINAAAK